MPLLCLCQSNSHAEERIDKGKDHFSCRIRSLGLLNFIRLWHDNTGQGQSASWFLKYIIVQDLQTMQKFHFIAQQWFAVEEGDGLVSVIILSFSLLILL